MSDQYKNTDADARQGATTGQEHRSVNRSLERGLAIVRCFRPGVGSLTNADIVERTNLPKATVSRLARTLVEMGFLRRDRVSQAYRLSFSMLSLAHAVLLDCQIAHEAIPLMHDVGMKHHINVGLSTVDHLDMVYLHVVHGDRSRLGRRMEPGHRRVVETTAIGHAYLASLNHAERAAYVEQLHSRNSRNWRAVSTDIDAALEQFDKKGYCTRIWHEDTESMAAPITFGDETFVFNLSYSVKEFSRRKITLELVPALADLQKAVLQRMTVDDA
ncbi:IclR family transcriptional regulator [Advenella kashmirensis W13003]|uniref:IclR family transcriptional regulator n=1 Tax=Advenella kashmirensis W13003 TaxID=1424334 RepID=V8QZM1_9BURK|nr:helix-turn-helix domain-containing protein [Advenella kashmirensis]ETF04464.1 IclR family transcriptional regulator [Advenella kashmirensis W13003]